MEENLVKWRTLKTIECLCLRTIGLIVALGFDVLETSVFALEASLVGQIFVLNVITHISTGQPSADSSWTETLIV